MNISFEKKILIGYIINLITLLAVGFIYWNHIFNQISILWNWVSLGLILLKLGMITIVYVIILIQLKAKNKIERLLLENEIHILVLSMSDFIEVTPLYLLITLPLFKKPV